MIEKIGVRSNGTFSDVLFTVAQRHFVAPGPAVINEQAERAAREIARAKALEIAHDRYKDSRDGIPEDVLAEIERTSRETLFERIACL